MDCSEFGESVCAARTFFDFVDTKATVSDRYRLASLMPYQWRELFGFVL